MKRVLHHIENFKRGYRTTRDIVAEPLEGWKTQNQQERVPISKE